MDLGQPDISLEMLDRWLVRACTSLMSTWDRDTGNFWRDSWKAAADTSEDETAESRVLGRGKGATSNNRSFQALVSACYFFTEHPGLGGSHAVADEMRAAASRMLNEYFTLPLDDIRGHGENRQNPFTDAQLLLSYAIALSPVTAEVCRVQLSDQVREALLRHLKMLSGVVAAQLASDGVKVHESARPHHFLTLHTVRALDAADRILAAESSSKQRRTNVEQRSTYASLLTQVRDEIVQQLGLHLLPAPGFDSSSLISCCALLRRFTGDADSPLLRQAVDALVEDQSTRGTWTSAGVLSFGRRRLVYIPSIELSVALADLVQADLYEADTDLFERALPALDASFRLVQSSFSRHEDKSGWRNDRTRSGYEVESWTTAVVLEFLLSYRQVGTLARQEQILRKYRAVRRPPAFSTFWPDLERLVPDSRRFQVLATRRLPTARLSAFSSLVDPTAKNDIVDGIKREILEPILRSVEERPQDTVSFLLFGPPGTRKTSLVIAAAEALGWPLILLSPPVFLSQGIEGFEAAAERIFEDLFQLKRVLVLFDECEEFFRWRPPNTTIESRTVGAFITSGMLPRLQRLRDNRWIVFVINSNAEAFELDDAVTRRGRLDKAARVGHPELGAQLRYLERWQSRSSQARLSTKHLAWFTSHLTRVEATMGPLREALEVDRVEAQKAHPDRGVDYRARMSDLQQQAARDLKQVVTFSMLDNLAERCLGEGNQTPITGLRALGENLKQEFIRFGPDSFAPSQGPHTRRSSAPRRARQRKRP
jgi:hypothetical protein